MYIQHAVSDREKIFIIDVSIKKKEITSQSLFHSSSEFQEGRKNKS
jgi:hypothetical protein